MWYSLVMEATALGRQRKPLWQSESTVHVGEGGRGSAVASTSCSLREERKKKWQGMQKETAEKEASNVRNAWLVYHDCSEGHPLCLISQGTSHGRDNSTTLLSGALRFSITSMHPLSWERETPIQTREKGEVNKQWSMIYEHFSGSLPASLLVMVGGGEQCWLLWGRACTPSLLHLSFSPEIYLCWLLKSHSECHLDKVEGP